MKREPAPGRKRWSVYRPSASRAPESADRTASPRPAQPAPAPSPPTRRRRIHPIGALIAAGGVTATLGVAAVFAVAGSDDGPFGGKSEVQVLTEDGVAGLVDAIDEETGRTEVFSATIYPTYAVVQVPVDASSGRYIGYHWDGHDLEEWAGKGTSTNDRVDLADVDPSVLLPLVEKMKARIEDPNSWYVIIDHTGDDGWISAYASNEYGEGGYIEVDLEGTEVRRASWPTEP